MKLFGYFIALTFISCQGSGEKGMENGETTDTTQTAIDNSEKQVEEFNGDKHLLFNTIQLTSPEGWLMDIQDSSANSWLCSFKQPETGESAFRPNFTVNKISTDLSPDDFVGAYISQIEKNYASLTVHKMNRANIGNFKDVVLFNYSMTLNSDKLGCLVAIYPFSGYYVLVSGMGLNNQKGQIGEYMKVYEDVIWSATKPVS